MRRKPQFKPNSFFWRLQEVAAALTDAPAALRRGAVARELTPNLATAQEPTAATNLLAEVDRAVQDVIAAVTRAQVTPNSLNANPQDRVLLKQASEVTVQNVISAVVQVQAALKPLMQTLNTSPCSTHTRGGAHEQDIISAATKAQALQLGRCAWPDDAAAAHAPVTRTVQERGHGMSAICHA